VKDKNKKRQKIKDSMELYDEALKSISDLLLHPDVDFEHGIEVLQTELENMLIIRNAIRDA